uniref:RING-type E3 ubiquitin transferase n=1 Tax=Kalanchoe fedtschenkoi TaxID=63787 RepID=A0A7N1A026_KALFE
MGDYFAAAEEEREVVEEEDKVFVAVGSDVESGKSVLEWTMRRFAGRRICLVHVHRPRRSGPVDIRLLAGKLKRLAVTVPEEGEVQKLLNEYTSFLSSKGVDADTLWIEMNDVPRGIVKLIRQYDIKCLVMGAASGTYESKFLTELKSKKALSVCEESPPSCLIWFVSKGRLIHTRGCAEGQDRVEVTYPVRFTRSDLGVSNVADLNVTPVMNKQRSASFLQTEKNSTINFGIEPWRTWKPVRSRPSLSLNSSKNGASDDFNSSKNGASVDFNSSKDEASDDCISSKNGAVFNSSKDGASDDFNLPASLPEAGEFESLWAAEVKRKRELEEILAQTINEVERMKKENTESVTQIQLVRATVPELESQLAESRDEVEESEEEMITAVELLISFKGKRDHMREEYGKAVREIHKLRSLVKRPVSILKGLPSLTLTFKEISEATQSFSPATKIGEGRNGTVYRGLLGHMIVAIKMLPDYGATGHLRFQQEAEWISKVRHPHLVTLVGICPDSMALIYEYLENGSLEDRLVCRGKSPPLSWQTRIRIASEICSVLIFLSSSKPPIIHGNLSPSNVLLGANLVSKISDLGVSRLIQNNSEISRNTNLAAECADPEFRETGELTPQSDTYSFGVILLHLLTGRPISGVVKMVTCAVEKGNVELVVDASAGNWPAEVTEQLLYIALRCCEKNGSDRPDLASEVLIALHEMRNSCMASMSSGASKTGRRPPPHFVCPIYQDVFEDPKIAADGYTYEGEAIEGWLNSGHNTSPMTNLKLDHCSLIPNYALHNAIQEWQQKF